MELKLPRGLAHDIEQGIQKTKGIVEVECRIRYPDSSCSDQYDTIIKHMSTKKDWNKTTSYTVDVYKGQKRFTMVGDRYFDTTKSSPIFLRIIDFQEFDLKFFVSSEKMKEVKSPKNYDFTRIKERTSFSKKGVRIDLTKVTNQKDDDVSYEIEVEIIDSDRFNYSEFVNTISMIIDINTDPHQRINSFFNKMLGGIKQDSQKLNWNLVSKPRDLMVEDMTNDGLLDNFTVMVKADGVMNFLVFHSTGVWLIGFSRDGNGRYQFLCPSSRDMEGSIFQGELIQKEYYLFDCCGYQSRSTIEDIYPERVKNFKHILGKRFGDINVLELKRFPYSQKKVEFFNKIREAFKEIKKVPYQTDGLIFMPTYCSYLPDGAKQRKKDRILSKYKDICKWKPSELQTIDFLVSEGNLLVAKNILFSGTEKYPFVKENYTLEDHDLGNIEGQIVEFKPVKKGDNFLYKPVRIRKDKLSPNSLHVALDGWELVRDPITKEMLTGRSTKLLDRYLRKLKNDITSTQQDDHILDIFGELDQLEKDHPEKEKVTVLSKNIKCDTGFKMITDWDEAKDYQNLAVNHLNPVTNIGLSDGLETLRRNNNGIVFRYLTISPSKLRSLFSIKGKELNFNDVSIRKNGPDRYTVTKETGEHDYELSDELEGNTPSGRMITDYILSKDERDLLQLFVVGTQHFDDKKDITISRIPVDISKGTLRKGGFDALGDDKLVGLEGDLFRLAVIDDGKSLQHSLLKLLNSDYRSESVTGRIDMASKMTQESDLDKISKQIGHGILLKNGDEEIKYGDQDRWIILFQHSDGTYEPVVHRQGSNMNMVFSKDSPLIQ
jgi:hypothetical protein